MTKLVIILLSSIIFVVGFNFLLNYLSSYFKSEQRLMLVNGKFKNQQRAMSFNKKIEKYKRWGILQKYPKMTNPIYYFEVHILFGAIFGVVLFFIHPMLFFVGFLVGYIGLDVVFALENISDNEKITVDVMNMYQSMYVQLCGGQYIVNAITDTKRVIKHKRLKRAIDDFETNINVHNMSILEAITFFEECFDNINISTFCTLVRQNEENGHIIDLLQDLSDQLKDMQEVIYAKRVEKTNRLLTVLMLIIFATVMLYVLYLFVAGIFQSGATQLFTM